MLQFTHPALLAGAALFAVPLIIHLLNRQRFRRRPWAAMEFLLAAYKKQRRRLRRENLLLLLLRCLIPIVLALAIARPLLREPHDVGASTGLVHHVLVVDHSYSMRLETAPGHTPFERTRTLAGALLDRIARNESPQKVTLFVNGLRPRAVLQGTLDVQRAKERIAQLPLPVDAGPPLTECLLQVADLVETADDPEIRVHVFTDLQVRAFGEDPFAHDPDAGAEPSEAAPEDPAPESAEAPEPPASEPTEAMFRDTAVDALQRISEKALVTLFDARDRGTAGGTEDNLVVTDLRLGRSHAILNVPFPVVATVRNRMQHGVELQVLLEIDGAQPVRRPLRLDAGSEGEVAFDVTLREPGEHQLRVEIEGDHLAPDNRRFAVVTAREKIKVLLVEGTAEDDPDLRESTHLAEVLDPTGGEGSPDVTQFALTQVDFLPFLTGQVAPQEFDVVVLASVTEISADVAEALLDALRSGTGLLVMFGPNTNFESFNRHLHASGTGPLPGRLLSEQGTEVGGERYYATAIERPDHPVFQDLDSDTYRQMLENLPVWRFVAMQRPQQPEATAPDAGAPAAEAGSEREPDAVVLLSVRDAERSPLWVASRFGAGKALFVTSPISRRPGRWNLHHTTAAGLTFLTIWPAMQWLALPALDERNVVAGQALTTVLREKPVNLRVVPPEAFATSVINVGEEATPLVGDRYGLPPFLGTDYAGFYAYQFERGDGQAQDDAVFAVNPDVDEGDLTYFSHDAAREHLGVDAIVTDLPRSGSTTAEAGSDELGPSLLVLLLVVLCAETAMARWVARRRA